MLAIHASNYYDVSLSGFVFFVVFLIQARVIRKGGNSIEGLPPSDWPNGKSVGGIVLIND